LKNEKGFAKLMYGGSHTSHLSPTQRWPLAGLFQIQRKFLIMFDCQLIIQTVMKGAINA